MLSRTCRRLCEPVQNANLPPGQPFKVTWFKHNMIIRRFGSYKSRWGTGMEHPSSGVPLQELAKMHCVDNTNCKHMRLLKQSSERFSVHRILPVVVQRVSYMRFKSGAGAMNRQKLKPGAVYWAVLFSRRQPNCRHSGLITQFDRNTGILINDKMVPLGTRVMYCAGRHVNHKVHLKTAVLANFIL